MLMELMEKYYEKRHMEREVATKKNAERMIASDAFSLFGAKGEAIMIFLKLVIWVERLVQQLNFL